MEDYFFDNLVTIFLLPTLSKLTISLPEFS